MARFQTVTLLTDYGTSDEFVGVLKSVIWSIVPDVRIVDLCHEIEPFDVRGAGLMLARSAQYLCPGVVLAVVDPGLPGPTSWKALKSRLTTAGYKVRDVHTVIVTHSHPDHFGAAGRVAKEAGAQLIAHKAFTTWSLQRKGATLSEAEIGRAHV